MFVNSFHNFVKNKCYVCGLGFENSLVHFENLGNVCSPCNSFMERIWKAKCQRDNNREDFWRLMFAKFIVNRSINS